ncbi:MAG: DUF3237 domain-containing protein [Alphaproteobacteria bacterium]
MTDQKLAKMTLNSEFLCQADIELHEGAPMLTPSIWHTRRVSNIVGGQITGPRLSGRILQSGADWSRSGVLEDGTVSTMLDVRSVWETDDGAQIYVTYGGRLVIPAAIIKDFVDPGQVEDIDPAEYYFRTLPTFETGAPQYDWLNHIVAVGIGQRTPKGVRYRIFQIT